MIQVNPGPTLPGNFPIGSQTEGRENRLKRSRYETQDHSTVIQRKVAVTSGFPILPHPSNLHVNAGLRLDISFCIKYCVFGRCCAQN